MPFESSKSRNVKNVKKGPNPAYPSSYIREVGAYSSYQPCLEENSLNSNFIEERML